MYVTSVSLCATFSVAGQYCQAAYHGYMGKNYTGKKQFTIVKTNSILVKHLNILQVKLLQVFYHLFPRRYFVSISYCCYLMINSDL